MVIIIVIIKIITAKVTDAIIVRLRRIQRKSGKRYGGVTGRYGWEVKNRGGGEFAWVRRVIIVGEGFRKNSSQYIQYCGPSQQVASYCNISTHSWGSTPRSPPFLFTPGMLTESLLLHTHLETQLTKITYHKIPSLEHSLPYSGSLFRPRGDFK